MGEWASVAIAIVALVVGLWQWRRSDERERRRDVQVAEVSRQEQLNASRQAIDRMVSRWRLGGLSTLNLATDPDIRAIAESSKRWRHNAAEDQALVAAASPAGKSLPYHLIDEAAKSLKGFEGVIDPIALDWTPDQSRLFEIDPHWKVRLQQQLDVMQNEMSSIIERLDAASPTDLSSPDPTSTP